MKRIVLTGGPCGGKTTVCSALKREFRSQIILIPETATLIIGAGFPVPGKDFSRSVDWQILFEDAIFSLQKSFEEVYKLKVGRNFGNLMVCDRGILDIVAYLPGGISQFCQRYAMKEEEALARYDAVIHLESLAMSNPCQYGRAGNEHRFSSLQYARRFEKMTLLAWANHPRRIIIKGKKKITEKISQAVEVVRFLLGEKA